MSVKRFSVFLLLTLAGCDKPPIYTLYRNSPIDPNMRLHMATVDAADRSPGYNRENCDLMAEAMQNRPGVTVKYWCEQGPFH